MKYKPIISKFKKARVLVVGDIILDEFIWGKVERISPEAPVPVVWADRQSYMPGGAANVADNINALGAQALIAGVIGADKNGEILREQLAARGIDTRGIIADEKRPTTLKTRIIAHHQQVVRVDREATDIIDRRIIEDIYNFIDSNIASVDAIIIEDYGKGMINPGLLRRLIPLAKRFKKIISVDPKVNHFSLYKDVTIITPNEQEAASASGINIKLDTDIQRAGRKLLSKLNAQAILITLGEKGMCLFQKNKKPRLIPTVAREVFDVSGAGDTVVAVLTVALGAGAGILEAAKLANLAAGIVVGKIGVATVSQKELIERISKG